MSEVAQVAICMGSDSDWPVMQAAALALEEFDVPHEVMVLSAHRMPLEMVEFGTAAVGRGLKVVIAGAGGAAQRCKCDGFGPRRIRGRGEGAGADAGDSAPRRQSHRDEAGGFCAQAGGRRRLCGRGSS